MLYDKTYISNYYTFFIVIATLCTAVSQILYEKSYIKIRQYRKLPKGAQAKLLQCTSDNKTKGALKFALRKVGQHYCNMRYYYNR